MSLLKTIKTRWNAKTPSFFKGIKKVAIAIGTPTMAIWLANQTLALELPEIVLSVCKYSIAVCAAMGVTAQLTKVDNPQDPAQ